MAHWRQNHETESDLLRSSDLYDSKTSAAQNRDAYVSPVVKIEKMTVGKVKSREKPRGENRNFAHFVGKSKPLGLNVGACETLTTLSGSVDPQRWVGLTIQLYVDPQAKYPNGKKGPAIRIRPKLPNGPADTAPLPSVPDADRERLDREQQERLEEDGREPGID